LSENLERLEERVKSTTDWRAQVERRPMTALGIAFGGGLLLGAVIPGMTRRSSASSRYRTSTTAAYTGQGYTGTSQGYTGSSEGTGASYLTGSQRTPKRTATSRELRKTWDMLDTIRASLVGFGASKLKEYLGSAIPGFEDHYRRTEEEKRREQGDATQHYSTQGMTGTATTGTTGTTGTQTPSYTTSTTEQR